MLWDVLVNWNSSQCHQQNGLILSVHGQENLMFALNTTHWGIAHQKCYDGGFRIWEEYTTWDDIDFDGPELSFYHLWHHHNHISVTSLTGGNNSGFVVGKHSRIIEQFNDHHEKIDVTVLTERLDDREFTFSVKRFGITVAWIIHLYSLEDGGSRFYAETVVGVDIPIIGWFINWTVVPFLYSKTTAEHWICHNIQETGRSESVILSCSITILKTCKARTLSTSITNTEGGKENIICGVCRGGKQAHQGRPIILRITAAHNDCSCLLFYCLYFL